LAIGIGRKPLEVWQLANGRRISTLVGRVDKAEALAFSRDAMLVASGGSNGVVDLWSVKDWRLLRSLELKLGAVTSLGFDTQGHLLVAGDRSGRIAILSPLDPGNQRLLHVHDGLGVDKLVVADNADVILTKGSQDNTVRIWKVPEGVLLREFAGGHEGVVASVRLSPDYRFLATASGDELGEVKVWGLTDGRLQRTLITHTEELSALAFSPSSRLLASAGYGRSAVVWDLENGSIVQMLDAMCGDLLPCEGAHSLAFSPDGKLLAFGGVGGGVKVWQLPRGAVIGAFRDAEEVRSVAFSPNGQLLASGGEDGVVKVRSIDGFDLVRGLACPFTPPWGCPLWSLAFSEDGQLLASGYWYGQVALWRVLDGALLRKIPAHQEGRVLCLGFLRQGSLLISASFLGPLKVWEVESGELKTIVELDSRNKIGPFTRCELSNDGSFFAAGTEAGSVLVWRLPELD
jgi:WD40 repeat protein